MQAYVIRRVLALVPTLIFASLIVFITVRMIPGDVIDLMLSTNDIGADKKSREQLESALGLDQPVYIQYFRWLGAILLDGSLVMVFPAIWWGWSPDVKLTPFTEDPLRQMGQMAIPALILGKAFSAVVMRLTRTMMLEVMRQDYIRTALAKGLATRTTILRHALRNALIPVVTLVGLQAPVLFGGAVILEQIFVIPGMGLLLLEAVSQRDYPIITGVFLIVGVAVVFINLLVDLSYGLLDPKVRYH